MTAQSAADSIQASIGRLAPVDEIRELLAEACAGLNAPVSDSEFRAAGRIARLALSFVHDRLADRDQAASAASEYVAWIQRLHDASTFEVRLDHVLLARAINAGKLRLPARVFAPAAQAIEKARVDQTVAGLVESGGNAGADVLDAAEIQLRCAAELVRAARLAGQSFATLSYLPNAVAVLDSFEAFAHVLDPYALYRARLAVGYAIRDLEGDWTAAEGYVDRALDNRPNDPRTDLTAGLHEASRPRFLAIPDKGPEHFSAIGDDKITAARLREDACLKELRANGLERHAESFLEFRKIFDPDA